MPAERKPIMCEALQSEEVATLPKRLRIHLGDDTRERDQWLVIHASWPLAGVVDQLNRLGAHGRSPHCEWTPARIWRRS